MQEQQGLSSLVLLHKLSFDALYIARKLPDKSLHKTKRLPYLANVWSLYLALLLPISFQTGQLLDFTK